MKMKMINNGGWRYFKQGKWYFKHNINAIPPVEANIPFKVGDAYQGFGKIIIKMDSTHFLSYNEKTNSMFTLTCRNLDKPLPNSVLDAYSFWKKIGMEQAIKDAKIPKSANRRNALIINAEEWLLGIWGAHGDFLECNETSALMLQEYDIDVFILNRHQQVINAFYMNPDHAEKQIINRDNGIIIKERPVFDHNDEIAILEQIFIYINGASCELECPLVEMHVVADCKCKKGMPGNYDKLAAEKSQFELFESETKRMINSCLTYEGLIVYRCEFANDV